MIAGCATSSRASLPPCWRRCWRAGGGGCGTAPGLGATIAVDVKHLYAWVRENNPRERVPHRFDPARQPRGDPDCRLGAKRLANQDRPRHDHEPEYLLGLRHRHRHRDRPGVRRRGARGGHATVQRAGRHLLPSRYDQAVANLGHAPTTWPPTPPSMPGTSTRLVPRPAAAAIPRNRRGSGARARPRWPPPLRPWPDDGTGHAFDHEDGFRARRYALPAVWPDATDQPCDHAQFAKGPGCTKYINVEAGGRMRADLDAPGTRYRAVYRQRTSAERINSQAKALGIERPKARRRRSIALNTLTYVVINARALQRVRAAKAVAHAPPPYVKADPPPERRGGRG